MATIATVYETGTEIDHVKWHHNRPLGQPTNNYGNHTGQILIVRHKIITMIRNNFNLGCLHVTNLEAGR